MKKPKTKQARYVVDRVGEGKHGRAQVFDNLTKAVEYFYSHEYEETGDGREFIAKEVSYQLEVDENKRQITVVPIGDFQSKEPYFLVDEYGNEHEGWGPGYDITSYEALSKLVKEGLPKVKGKSIIAHELELKLEDDK